jgi:hypothetical protein
MKKYPCGCVIQTSERCSAFFVSLCDYHRGEMNTASASLEQIEYKMQEDEINTKSCPKTVYTKKSAHEF